jgi:glutamine amidotransferase
VARDVVVIDYGSGNTRSMLNALKKVLSDDQQVILSRDPQQIEGADRLVLPGVGAFAECRRKLDRSEALPSLTAAVRAGRPFLGVCVGMQILADEGR